MSIDHEFILFRIFMKFILNFIIFRNILVALRSSLKSSCLAFLIAHIVFIWCWWIARLLGKITLQSFCGFSGHWRNRMVFEWVFAIDPISILKFNSQLNNIFLQQHLFHLQFHRLPRHLNSSSVTLSAQYRHRKRLIALPPCLALNKPQPSHPNTRKSLRGCSLLVVIMVVEYKS